MPLPPKKSTPEQERVTTPPPFRPRLRPNPNIPSPRELDSPPPDSPPVSSDPAAEIEFKKPPALPGSLDSFPTLSDAEAQRIWDWMQQASERLRDLEKDRRRDLVRLLQLQDTVEETDRKAEGSLAGIQSAAEAFGELRKDQRRLESRLNRSMQDDVVTAQHLADLERRLNKAADLAGSEAGGRAGRTAGRKTATKLGSVIGALMIVLEIARLIYASHEAPRETPRPTSTGWTQR